MAYSTSNPPALLIDRVGGAGAMWSYRSADAPAVVQVSGYITNGGALGMKVGDIVIVTDTDASPVTNQLMNVVSVSATYPGAADLSDGTAITATDTD